ncbi:MAG: hypothetical protein AB7P00_14590 [Sandaracinaceae bacterium]
MSSPLGDKAIEVAAAPSGAYVLPRGPDGVLVLERTERKDLWGKRAAVALLGTLAVMAVLYGVNGVLSLLGDPRESSWHERMDYLMAAARYVYPVVGLALGPLLAWRVVRPFTHVLTRVRLGVPVQVEGRSVGALLRLKKDLERGSLTLHCEFESISLACRSAEGVTALANTIDAHRTRVEDAAQQQAIEVSAASGGTYSLSWEDEVPVLTCTERVPPRGRRVLRTLGIAAATTLGLYGIGFGLSLFHPANPGAFGLIAYLLYAGQCFYPFVGLAVGWMATAKGPPPPPLRKVTLGSPLQVDGRVVGELLRIERAPQRRALTLHCEAETVVLTCREASGVDRLADVVEATQRIILSRGAT